MESCCKNSDSYRAEVTSAAGFGAKVVAAAAMGGSGGWGMAFRFSSYGACGVGGGAIFPFVFVSSELWCLLAFFFVVGQG